MPTRSSGFLFEWLKNRKILFSYFIEILIILILAITAIIINQRMIRNGIIFEANDIKYHIAWLQHFSKQLSEGIWYPRWLAGDNYGYGSPTFVFYPPLVFYLGSLLKSTGLNTEQTIISLFTLAIFLAGFSFYVYGCNRWGKIASITGALFYMTTPYIAFNIYCRGALPETWSLIWIPFGLWVTEKSFVRPKWRIVLGIVAAIVALTHVPSLLLFTIVWLFYVVYSLKYRSWKAVIKTVFSLFIGFGLVSFYLFPAILEKSLVNIKFMKFGDGYKLNLISFGITKNTNIVRKFIQPIFIYDCLAILLLLAIVILCLKEKRKITKSIGNWLFFLTSLLGLMLYPSVLIWQASETLQMVQFPWRLLGLFSFGIAALCSIAVNEVIKKNKYWKMGGFLIITMLIFSNTFYSYKLSLTLPGFHNPGNIALAKEKGKWKASIYYQIKTALEDPYTNKLRGTKEYLPLLNNGQAASAPKPGQPSVYLKSGKAKINLEHWGSYKRSFQVISEEASTIKIRTYYYPAWHLYINDRIQKINVDRDGIMQVKLDPGIYNLKLDYQWTPTFKAGVILSILSSIVLIFINTRYVVNY